MGDHTEATEAPSLEDLAARQAKLERTVRALADTIARLVDQRPASTPTTPTTSDRDELAEWVHWLIDRYELGYAIPECWAQHGAIVEELKALHAGWLTAVANGTGLSAAQWHDYLNRALDRIDHGRWRTCTDGVHRTSHVS